jgi:cAMP-binding proteins - catabolite gene activator and regulatory subunit of cAMP-dependent protein kinases
VYAEGEAAESMYIVRSGLVQIESTVNLEKQNIWPISEPGNPNRWRKTKTIREMKFTHKVYPKEYFGEIEILKSCKRQHQAVCVKNCQLLILNRNDFTSSNFQTFLLIV